MTKPDGSNRNSNSGRRVQCNHAARFDVVAVTWPAGAKRPTIEHIMDAFPAVGRGQFSS
jgi:hypothetical protein